MTCARVAIICHIIQWLCGGEKGLSMLEIVHVIEEHQIMLFLLQVLLLLGCARGLGLLFSRYGQPSITAEILVGIVFGPTILGRLLPGLHMALFPPDAVQQGMLEAVAWIGILFFLLDTGLETDFATAWRQRHSALIISFSDLILPMIIAFIPCLLLPDHFLVDPEGRLMFAFFVATIMTISALPVTARVLQELKLYRTDTGLLIMGALTINDVAGWLVFAVILGIAGEAIVSMAQIPLILLATVAFTVACLSVGRRLTNRALEQFSLWKLPEPGTSLTFICLLGLLGGVFTAWIGIHALFGFFIAGIMAGESRALKENTRQVMSQMVRAVLVPVFFATIGLKIDFAAGFHPGLVVLLLVVGIGGRFAGAWVGSWLSRQPRGNWTIISAAHTPGGEMQIVIGMLALEYGVISEPVYVAVIFGAVFSSVILGPWMRRAMRPALRVPVLDFLQPAAVYLHMNARDRAAALRELCRVAAGLNRALDPDAVHMAVAQREDAMGTSLGGGVAVPHARLPDITKPLVVMGRSVHGIDWNAPDAVPARLFFLLLTPADDAEQQIRILGAIAKALSNDEIRDALMNAATPQMYYQTLVDAVEAVCASK